MYLKSTKEVTYNDTKTTSKTVLMTGTLEEIYQNGEFKPLDLDEYIEKVSLFLQYLSLHGTQE